MTLLFAVSLTAQETESAADRAAINAIVKQYVAKITARDYAAAAAIFHAPASKAAEDRSSLHEDLLVVHAELGGIGSVHRFDDDRDYLAGVGIGAGTLPYWDRHPELATREIGATYEKGDRGVVRFSFGRIDDRWVLRKVNYEVLVTTPERLEKMKQFLSRFMRLPDAKKK
ncbi:MAG TPA: hypothetical protein VFV54_00195 [Thermoanaerobaculia bacterium]|nr:hypothetical protein [Thermoanaerobaculia bacterium]